MHRLGLPLALVLTVPAAQAATRTVGPEAEHKTLAAAVAAAQPGDVIHVGAGVYYECAVLSRHDLVLEGEGEATVLSDTTCQGKAIIVATGDRLTVRNLTLARARVPDGNGAGIRLEGQGLLLDRVRFDNNQVGLLAGLGGPGQIVIRDCLFTRGGVAGERPTMAVSVGAVALLRIERTVFTDVKGGQVSTAAERSELVGDTIGTGIEPGAGPAIQASGPLLLEDSVIAVGPNLPPRDAAIAATGPAAVLNRNRLQNGTGQKLVLLLDWTSGTPSLSGNVVGPGDTEVSGAGLLRHRAGNMARGVLGDVRSVAGRAKRAVMGP